MFYIIVALWAIACLGCYVLRRLQKKVLRASCIAVPLVGALASWILMESHASGAAIAILLLSVYVFVVLLSAVITYKTNRHSASA